MRTTRTTININPKTSPIRSTQRATRTFAGLAAAVALTLGAAACSSDETDPGGDDPIDVPDETIPADPAIDE